MHPDTDPQWKEVTLTFDITDISGDIHVILLDKVRYTCRCTIMQPPTWCSSSVHIKHTRTYTYIHTYTHPHSVYGHTPSDDWSFPWPTFWAWFSLKPQRPTPLTWWLRMSLKTIESCKSSRYSPRSSLYMDQALMTILLASDMMYVSFVYFFSSLFVWTYSQLVSEVYTTTGDTGPGQERPRADAFDWSSHVQRPFTNTGQCAQGKDDYTQKEAACWLAAALVLFCTHHLICWLTLPSISLHLSRLLGMRALS